MIKFKPNQQLFKIKLNLKLIFKQTLIDKVCRHLKSILRRFMQGCSQLVKLEQPAC